MTDTGNGSDWRRVMRRVRWVTFSIAFAGNMLAFTAVGGWYASSITHRMETVEDEIDKVSDTLSLHRTRVSAIEAKQAATDTSTARLEERLAAQSASLQRIETMLQELTRDVYDPRQRQ